ncbi:RNA-directed DNA polymerase (Reverse transcriptase) [Crinalium epipsammum PCC 9333]|uniref:RNA-directed DNA polymerase (Reverse transcriptase) n=1 Tax=Crinalium epipsammum PCC 9333 TaxID=1173022 RepID=K9VVI1_9CYAN|nr:group II intron reverse transcriptase/maturase [Crinalium epipsammum]AFZ11549.1 RNA-directed DNA polymerase (Reverse transcriptase) [Crinalium epipsammum PCC 9333]
MSQLEINILHSQTQRDLTSSDIVEEFLSRENFQRAWRKVAENQGSAGVDEETTDDFNHNLNSNLSQLRDAVANSTYQPLPFKQVFIPKQKGSWRELKIPTVRDRIVQQALLNVLAPIMENKFSPASFAYRPHMSYINAVEQVAHWRDLGYHWVMDADVSKYFDSIDHQRLLIVVRKYLDNPGILCLIKAWISAGVLTKEGIVRNDKGIPQGAVISPMLANIYLDEFDKIISASDLKLVRYADDFLVLATTQERIVKAYSEVEQILNSFKLTLHPEKTQITNFERGFRFLGHGFLENAIFPVESSKTVSASGVEGKGSKKKLSTRNDASKANRNSASIAIATSVNFRN